MQPETYNSDFWLRLIAESASAEPARTQRAEHAEHWRSDADKKHPFFATCNFANAARSQVRGYTSVIPFKVTKAFDA